MAEAIYECQCADQAGCVTATEQIKGCIFAEWYAKIEPLRLTYKSKVLEVSPLFVQHYLLADGMH